MSSNNRNDEKHSLISSFNETNEKEKEVIKNDGLDSSILKSRTKTVSLTIPEDAAVGDVLTFVVDGNELEISMPEGSFPGDVLQIQISENPKQSSPSKLAELSENTIDDGSRCVEDYKLVTVKLSKEINDDSTDCITLELETKLSESENTENKCIDDCDENNICDGTYAMAWPTGLILAQWIYQNRDFIPMKTNNDDSSSQKAEIENIPKLGGVIVELGSGLGTVGLAVAMALSSSSVLTQQQQQHLIIMTDVPKALPLLQKNITRNLGKVSPNNSVQVTAQSWIWGQSPPIFYRPQEKDCSTKPMKRKKLACTNAVEMKKESKQQKIDWILASDVLYQTNDSYESLIQTISTCNQSCDINYDKNNSTTRYGMPFVLLGVRWRKPELERVFFQKLTSFGYVWKSMEVNENVKKAKIFCPFDYINNFGTPQMVQYLSQTIVLAGGKSIPLNDLTEEDMNKMSDNEYDALEQQQTQIYIGIPPPTALNSDISHSNKRPKTK